MVHFWQLPDFYFFAEPKVGRDYCFAGICSHSVVCPDGVVDLGLGHRARDLWCCELCFSQNRRRARYRDSGCKCDFCVNHRCQHRISSGVHKSCCARDVEVWLPSASGGRDCGGKFGFGDVDPTKHLAHRFRLCRRSQCGFTVSGGGGAGAYAGFFLRDSDPCCGQTAPQLGGASCDRTN